MTESFGESLDAENIANHPHCPIKGGESHSDAGEPDCEKDVPSDSLIGFVIQG